jgi:hypothetical protein
MAAEDLNLTGIKSLAQALARTKNGEAAVELARRLGVWTQDAHAATEVRRPFARNLSEMTPSQITDLYAYWTSEYGRIIELCGAINAQDTLLKIQLRSAQASARARIRRTVPEGGKTLTAAQLTDQAEEDSQVIDLSDQTALVAVLKAHADAAKEATQQYLATISREISFRDAQMKARIM